nr:unnamed protein product [Callosobruchus chinensis]
MNRKLADRIPALAVLSEEKLVEGQLEFVTVHTEMVNRRRKHRVGVDIEAENIKVKSVKKTAKGDLLMEVVGSCNAERLKKAIKENMGDAQTIHRAMEWCFTLRT